MPKILACLFSFAAHSAPITITQVSNLNFGTALWGDRAKTIRAGNSDDAENASFLITGDARSRFNVVLPNQIWMNHVSRPDRILINNFESRPNNLRMGRDGQLVLLIGATRSAIPTTISAGSYAGTFTITVVY